MLKDNEYKKFLILIVILALIVRFIYVIKTPYTEKQHDLDLSYILTIYETGHLPQSNEGQYYHPPFHQIIGATFLKIENIFVNNIEEDFAGESLQFLTLIYSMIILYVIYKIAKEIKLKKKHILYVMFITAFNPTLIILSGSLNNDELCIVLMMWSILRLIKWYKKSDIKNTVFLAITTGLAVMTKTNGAIVAVPIMYIFLLKLYKELRKTDNKIIITKKYLYLFVIFGTISLPIGLWYHARNYILFKQPILYILDTNNQDLYVGNYSLLERFLPFSKEIFQMYCNAFEDYNIITYLIKCSLFGEFSWGNGKLKCIYYTIAIILNIILSIISLYCIIKNTLTKNKRKKVWKNILFLLWITNIISFISMNLKLPYGCSMDFRYIVPTIFIQAIFICFELENIMRKNKKKGNIIFAYIFELTLVLMLFSDIIILT